MRQAVVVRAVGETAYLGVRLFAGEALDFEIADLPEGARITVTLGLDAAQSPLIQRSGGDRVELSAKDLAPLPEGAAAIYNVWLEQDAGRRLLQHGSIVARPTIAPEGPEAAPIAAPVATGLADLSFYAGQGLEIDLAAGFEGTQLSFAPAPGSDPLPTGLSLSNTGLLSGRIDSAGRHSLVIRASNVAGHADAGFAIEVTADTTVRTFDASAGRPILITDGDSVTANPGFREALLWRLGDVTFTPEDYQQATGGHNVQHMLDDAQAVVSRIVPGQTIVMVGPVGANWDGANPTAPFTPSADKLAQLYDLYLDAGATVVAVPTLPDGYDDPAAPNTSRVEKFDAMRAVTARYAATRIDFHAVDTTGFDPVTMKNDTTHPNVEKGAVFLADRTAEVIAPLISGSRMAGTNLIGAGFATFDGDSATTVANVTGPQPSGWNYSTLGAGQWSVARDANGDLVFSITDAPDKSQIRINRSVPVTHSAGDILDGIFELEIDAGATGFSGVQTDLSGNGLWGPHSDTAMVPPPTGAVFARTRGAAQTRAGSARNLLLAVGCVAGGSVTFTLRRVAMIRVGNAAGALAITGAPATTVANGQSYSFTPTVSGGTAPYAFDLASGVLPAGLALDPDRGEIGGTVTAEGRHTGIALRVTDSLGATAILTPFGIEVTAAGVPVNTVAPTLDNTGPAEGDTITVDPGAFDPPATSHELQWLHSGNIQEGETGPTHKVPVGTAPQTVSCRVVGIDANGRSAAIETAPTDPVTAAAAAVAGWDSTAPTWTEFGGVTQASHADQDRTVSAVATTNGQRNHVGADAIGGKVYFEIELASDVNFVGVGDDGVSINSGSLTADRYGKSGGIIYHSGGNRFVGNVLADGQRVGLAVDVDAGLFWLRQDTGPWNEDAAADPASGVGGLDISALTAPLRPVVQLKNATTARAILHGTTDRLLHPAPSGFGPIL